jgi:hypothetical protein
MKRKIFLTLAILIFSVACVNAQVLKKSTAELPTGCIIENGFLKAKQGFSFQLSADKKTATLINAKNNISGTFNCTCSGGKAGNYYAEWRSYQMHWQL